MCEHKQSKHGPAWHTALLMLLDAFLTVAAMMMALQIYYDMEAPQAHIVHVWHIAPTHTGGAYGGIFLCGGAVQNPDALCQRGGIGADCHGRTAGIRHYLPFFAGVLYHSK